MGRGEAKRLGLPWFFVTRAKRRVGAGRDLRIDAAQRLRAVLVGG